jgi:hypothetical protein
VAERNGDTAFELRDPKRRRRCALPAHSK